MPDESKIPQAEDGSHEGIRQDILKKTEEARAEQTKQKAESFSRKEIVNGIEISVFWDGRQYNIYFPGIEMGRVEGVNDQVLMLGQDPDDAELVADYARKIAKAELDVYKVFKKVEKFTTRLAE